MLNMAKPEIVVVNGKTTLVLNLYYKPSLQTCWILRWFSTPREAQLCVLLSIPCVDKLLEYSSCVSLSFSEGHTYT